MINKIKNKLYYNESIWGIGSCEISDIDEIFDLKDKFKQVLSYKDVTDTKAVFLADPFVIKNNDMWYMFFEIYEQKSKKGLIGLATSKNLKEWKYERIVLEENFHLSYPYVFQEDEKIYMMPETGESGYIKIYEAINFPYEWKCIKNIVKGNYWDSSLFKYDGKWWLFSKTSKPKAHSLSLFYSDNLLSGWKEHCKSPIVTENKCISRPGGRVFVDGDKIIRFAQDYLNYYGDKVRAIEINKLTIDDYKEKEIGIIIGGSNKNNSWNKDGMHTFEITKNGEGYLLIADGFKYKRINKIYDRINSKL